MSPASRRFALSLLALGLTVPFARPAAAKPLRGAPAHGGKAGGYANRREVLDWVREQTRDGAPLAKLGPAQVLRDLAQARYRADVAQLILPAPAGVAKNWAAYRDRFVEPLRLQAGLRFWQDHEAALTRAERQYGVPAELVLGILGVETYYGRIMGRHRVLDALTTLGFDFPGGRSDRSPFFREQLAEFLLLAESEGKPATEFLGSFAGAMGLGQFMPSSWRAHAVDFDGDGHIDLIGNASDAIGSVAHFLRDHGWQPGMPTHALIDAPADAETRARLLAPDIEPRWHPADLQAAQLQLPAALQGHGPFAFVALQNGQQSVDSHLLASHNFWVVTRYNRSAYYALAVIQLGERIAQLRKA